MPSEMRGVLRPSLYRFKLGSFEVATVLDAVARREGLHPTFGADRPAAAVAELARANRLPADRHEHPFTPTLLNTGTQLILFDAGLGSSLPNMPKGRLRELLREAGHAPEDIDLVVITHGHPDHVGGLIDDGAPAYPNAGYVFGAREFDYWTRGENISDARKATRELFMRTAAPLADRARFVAPGDEIAAGVTAVEAFGHSAGLMAYHFESEGRRLLLWADVTNHYVVSLQRPEWQVFHDDDKELAVATRKRVLDMAAADDLWVVGFHMPFPALGFVERSADGYRWVPASYQLNL